MKRRHLLTRLAPVAILTVATSLVGCEKKPETPKTESSAQPAAKPAERAVVPAATVLAAAGSDTAAFRDTYGLAAKLPQDVEAFSANYRLGELWDKFSNSNWAATFLNLPAVKSDPKFGDFLEQWRTAPQAQMARKLMDGLFGTEVVIVSPAGFTGKFKPWIDLLGELQSVNFQRGFMGAMGGRQPDPKQLLRDAAPEIVPVLVKCEMPPVLFAFKASKAKAEIDGPLGMFVQQMGTQLPPGVELGAFKLADKHEFQSITVTAKKLLAGKEESVQAQLKEMLGDDAKVKETMDALMTKQVEIAWGWMDDYFLISLGADHSHLKFASGDASSALAIPVVARRAAQFAGKQPLGLNYASTAMFEALSGPVQFSKKFDTLSEELSGILKPEHIAAMQKDVKRLEASAQPIFTAKFDPLVGVSFWDGGMRSETFGGIRQTGFDATKPLGFGSLLTHSVFLLADSRMNSANAGKLANFIEECATTLFGWYDKYGRAMVPEGERMQAQLGEMMVLPVVKDFWRSSRLLAGALGDESAFVLDLNGNMPKIPDLPPALAEGKVPRLAWVHELKNRAGVSEAWAGFNKCIQQVTALAKVIAIPEPQMKQDGDVELYFIAPPIPTDDFLPHIAITKDRWIFSTSPSLTKEVATKPAASGGTPLGSEWKVQFPALCDLAEAWMKVIDKDPSALITSSSDLREYLKMRPTLGVAVRLMRSMHSFEWRIFDEAGETRNSTFLKLEDVK